MASSSYLARVIYKDGSNWKLLCPAKSIGTPMGTPNLIEKTTLEDNTQCFVRGIFQSEAIELTCNLENDVFTKVNAMGDTEQEFIFLYGSEGTGNVLKVTRKGTAVASPSEVSVDTVLEMTVTITPTTQADIITKTVTDNGDGTFTVAD